MHIFGFFKNKFNPNATVTQKNADEVVFDERQDEKVEFSNQT